VEGGEQGAAPGAEQGTEQAIRAEVFAAQEEAGVGEVGDDDDEEGAEEGGSDDDGGSDDEEGERDDAKGESKGGSKGDSKGAAQKKSRLVDNASGGTRGAFHLRLFALLLRYKSLRGHGFQAAVGPDVWKVLTSKLEVGFECFASPLNAYLPAYSSGFTDVDAPFGSSGSFFGLSALKGSFAANPPFVHSIMDAAAEHALSLLDAATKAQGDHALSFVFFLPGWTESAPFLRRIATLHTATPTLISPPSMTPTQGAPQTNTSNQHLKPSST
jgi:phosphorylated CTD-interacting factor 1|tara:strand:+ start:664 stop:1476 length:813 start_codon:yes stop_codon:yes gene_type:complete